jgi:UDP-2,3-diacylglucosamine hydrolase
MGIANFSSRRSRAVTGDNDGTFLGEENEWLIQYCKEVLKSRQYDYLIFGHRHLPIDFTLAAGNRYINLGDWINYFTYAVFDGQQLTLQSRYPELESKIVRK